MLTCVFLIFVTNHYTIINWKTQRLWEKSANTKGRLSDPGNAPHTCENRLRLSDWCKSCSSTKLVLLCPLNPLALRAAKTGLTILLIFSSQKRFYQKYLKEKCLSEYYQQLSFKYFVRICFIFKLSSKV